MNLNILQGKSKQLKSQLKTWWNKLTGDDIEQIQGNSKKLIGILQQRYGWSLTQTKRIIEQRLEMYQQGWGKPKIKDQPDLGWIYVGSQPRESIGTQKREGNIQNRGNYQSDYRKQYGSARRQGAGRRQSSNQQDYNQEQNVSEESGIRSQGGGEDWGIQNNPENRDDANQQQLDSEEYDEEGPYSRGEGEEDVGRGFQQGYGSPGQFRQGHDQSEMEKRLRAEASSGKDYGQVKQSEGEGSQNLSSQNYARPISQGNYCSYCGSYIGGQQSQEKYNESEGEASEYSSQERNPSGMGQSPSSEDYEHAEDWANESQEPSRSETRGSSRGLRSGGRGSEKRSESRHKGSSRHKNKR